MDKELEDESILIYDIETDGLDTSSAKCKWFGAYSYKTNTYHILPYKDMKEINQLIEQHKILIGFNNKEFDNEILSNQHNIDFNYKCILDLYNISKMRLPAMGIKINNYKLKTIIDTLKISKQSKGEIDYNTFIKDEWTNKEIDEIKTYLKQDILITKDLFEWFFKQFKPLRKLLSLKDKNKLMDVKASLASLAFRIICNLSGYECSFEDDSEKDKNKKRETFAGGHHIEAREKKAVGNIVSIDITSAYPHAIMMGNLLSSTIKPGWEGGDFFNLKGKYSNEKQGKAEAALKKIFFERLKAKEAKDKIKDLAYKIVINSFYGTIGNSIFKTFYNPIAAGDCTSIVRTILKKLAKTCEENGFKVLYGFTDNVVVLIPEESNKEELMLMADIFIQDVKKHFPFPMESFELKIDKEFKFIYFFAKNCYLWVDKENKIGYKSTVFNKNTPAVVMDVFNNKISPVIIKKYDINFKEDELEGYIRDILKKNLKLSGAEYSTKQLKEYKSKTSLQYQISQAYGEGKHFLIPNLKSIGVGKAKSTKKKIGVRYCTQKEFDENKLKYDDIDVSQLMKHLKVFIKPELFIDTNSIKQKEEQK